MVVAGAVVAGGSGAVVMAVVGSVPAVADGETPELLQANAITPNSSAVSAGSERAGLGPAGRLS